MPHVDVQIDGIEFDDPTLIEGLPGVGLVGKIAADHLVRTFDMPHYASVYCDGLPRVAVYREGEPDLRPPVRLHADADRNLLVLQSDVPVSPSDATDFATCIVNWLDEHGVTPLYLSGLPTEDTEDAEGAPALRGVSTGMGSNVLDRAGLAPVDESGVISGPTGALLHRSVEIGLSSVGLVIESDPRFPDPGAAQVLLEDGIEPITDIEIDTDDLVEQAERTRTAREQLAARMQQADDESTQAQPLQMYQ